MAGSTNFPTSFDIFPFIEPATLRDAAGKSLSGMTNNASAALLALQTKVGIDSSAEPTSLDKRIADIEGSGVGFDGTKLLGINIQTGTSYTPTIDDPGWNIRCTNGADITVTIPPAASVPYAANTVLYISQGGAGAVSIAPGAAVTINNPDSTATTAKGTWLAVVNVGADEWDVV